ncbi:hypothetical protein Pure05_27560 [Paenarthrobacter ureafaciens]|nr:hypothetical protein ARZXY2_1765 [Arthrobacter sp. ZXY-2]GLU60415.1 hypothetical protein Pure01_29280 [Paenarthrobacter ureafaciens]GLU64513.1 hypothetical protein Pure02_27630 [Paenarthrobacter ureafaciens]GLU68792.1 hypothetical protein Pure03_27680 [Paenarthrobacter ureafaciens]GLU73222.1 hypothetical protein Pure04_29370 [Paenarthrobacter ureafaciens]
MIIINSPEEAERILTQVVENIQRAELTDADEADAYHQLSLLGVSAAAIAKKTGRKKAVVEDALKAKSSEAGTAALGRGLTIEEALILAEFEGDEEATLELESVIADEPTSCSTSPSNSGTNANVPPPWLRTPQKWKPPGPPSLNGPDTTTKKPPPSRP